MVTLDRDVVYCGHLKRKLWSVRSWGFCWLSVLRLQARLCQIWSRHLSVLHKRSGYLILPVEEEEGNETPTPELTAFVTGVPLPFSTSSNFSRACECVRVFGGSLSVYFSVCRRVFAESSASARLTAALIERKVQMYWSVDLILHCFDAAVTWEAAVCLCVFVFAHTQKRVKGPRKHTPRIFLAPFPSCLTPWCVLQCHF